MVVSFVLLTAKNLLRGSKSYVFNSFFPGIWRQLRQRTNHVAILPCFFPIFSDFLHWRYGSLRTDGNDKSISLSEHLLNLMSVCSWTFRLIQDVQKQPPVERLLKASVPTWSTSPRKARRLLPPTLATVILPTVSYGAPLELRLW